MADRTLITDISDWLIEEALGDPDMIDMFRRMCERIYAAGIPICRSMATWTTLHPLVAVEQATWFRSGETEFNQILHQRELAVGWTASPMKYMLDHETDVLRRRLTGPNRLIDFPVLEEFAERGYTDYLAMTAPYKMPGGDSANVGSLITWATDREGGFTDDDIAALQRLKVRYALAAKSVIQSRITRNITETYLGAKAAEKVLSGHIQRGDREPIDAVVWYSDMRRSTELADTLPSDEFTEILNGYFESIAGAVMEHGGEVLDFIGDAVLAIFPIPKNGNIASAAKAATAGVKMAAGGMAKINAQREAEGLEPIGYGIGLTRGEVMFGNMGLPQRLTFSVIGPTVNEAARIETLTKTIGEPLLATAEIAAAQPQFWQPVGQHTLEGIGEKIAVYALKETR